MGHSGKVLSKLIAIVVGLSTIYKFVATDGPALRAQGAQYPVFYLAKKTDQPTLLPFVQLQRRFPPLDRIWSFNVPILARVGGTLN